MESPQSIFSPQSPCTDETTPKRRYKKASRVEITFQSVADTINFEDSPLPEGHIERSPARLELCEG